MTNYFPKTTNETTISQLVPGSATAYLSFSLYQRPRVRFSFQNQMVFNSGVITVRRDDNKQVLQTFTFNQAVEGVTNTWTGPAITGLVPDTWYEVVVPEGFVNLTFYGTVVGINAGFTWRFKTLPPGSVISYELDSYPYTDDLGSLATNNIINTTKRRINRTSNVKFKFGRKFIGFTQTFENAPADVGIRQTPPNNLILELYKKTGNELVETIDLSKSFTVDRIGVQYTTTAGTITFSFTERFEPDTEYYMKIYNACFDLLFNTGTGTITDPLILTFKTDGVKIVFASHDPEVENGFFNIGFDRPVVAGNGVLRIIDETAGRIINELRPDDYSAVFYDQTQTNGMSYSLVKDDWMLK